MAANTDTTRILIDLDSRIRNLERTLRGLDQIKKRLDAIGGIKTSTQGVDRAAVAAQKLALQQQKLVIQTQELANRQEKARQTAEKLARSQENIAKASQKVSDADKKIRDSQKQFEKRVAAESKRNAAAAESLQRQRSAALIKQFKDQEREQERARKSILTLDQALGRVGGSLRNLGLGLTSLGASLSVALTAPLTALGVISTRNAVTLDSLKRGLEAITGSADEAGIQLKRLTEIAKLPGIGFQEAIQGSIRLQAVGFSAEKAEKALVQFSNAVALTGGGRDELNRITVQLGQLSAKGKVLSQDLKPIIEAGPAVGRALKEAFGTVNAEDIQALGLTSEQFLDRLVTQLEKLPRAAGGARNTLENFSDALFRASAAIGDAILPVLTKLITVVEPVITALANGFKSLPPVLQVLIIGFGGLVAAIGPALFIFGQFATGIGGLLSAFGRLHALGLLPTIKGFQLLGQVMRGTASLAAGQAATTAAAAAGWIALGAGVIVAVGALLLATGAIAAYVKSQKSSNKVSQDQIKATNDQINSLKSQISFVESLSGKVKRTADEENRLVDIYGRLNTQAKIRVTGISDEEKRLEQLRKELERLLALRREEQGQQAANLAANLANTAAQIRANELARENISTQIEVNTRLAQSIQATGRINTDQARLLAAQLGPLGQNIGDVETATRALNLRNESLIEQQSTLIDGAKELTTKAQEQGDALVALEKNGAGTTRQFLALAKQIGLFTGSIDDALVAMNRFITAQEAGIPVLDAFTRALEQQNKELLQAGEAADALAKGRRDLIGAAVSLAREASSSFKGALADLRAFIAAQPDLRAAFEKEAQLAGKSFDEFVEEALGGKAKGRAGTSLRNAQEQLAKAVEGVAEAAAERQRQIDRDKNEDLLQQNENAYRLQLIAYEQYLRTREFLTRQNIEVEIREQEALHTRALAEQERFLARSRKAGIPASERTKSIAEAAEAEQGAVEAETRIRALRAEQSRVTVDTNQAIAEAAQQQIKDIRQLDVEFAELRGSIEDALNTQTVERFRERLLALGKAQENIRGQLQLARALGPEETERLNTALKRNQAEIDLIELIQQQEFATNKLAAANEFVRRAKEKQADLETQLTFEIEFRGLKEEEAIKRRLEGERKLADSLRVVRDLVQAEIDALNAKGVNPPQALLDFVRETSAAIKGLGELPFNEQFRLVEKEFNRLNDERLDKIADIERAIRERDIAEAEGLLIIRRINGQYSADLERQVELLKQIAAASNDASLQRQAQQAEQAAKDANSQLADFNRQLRSTSIDALQDGFTDFFASIGDRSRTAKEKLLDLVDSIVARINQVIAENLSKKLIESLFGGGDADTGIIASIGRLFGLGGKGAQGGAGGAIAGGISQTAEATAAATALTTGATAAATALTTGGATAGATLVTSITAGATAFASSVIAAGAAFAATVAAAGAAAGVSQGLGGLGAGLGAATGIFPAIPGGAIRIVEGGYPEAVLTTDPRHAARQVGILRELIRRTRGFYGRVVLPEFATGGFPLSRANAESNMLSAINRAPSFSPPIPDAALQATGGSGDVNVRIVNQVESRALARPYLTSQEGVRDILNIVSTNSNHISRRINR